MTVALAIVAGSVGSALRYVVTHAVQVRWGREWPSGALVVNVAGSFLAGLAAGSVTGDAATVLLGLIAGFTTFSAWMVEAVILWDHNGGGHLRALLDLVGPVLAGLALAAVGLLLGRAF